MPCTNQPPPPQAVFFSYFDFTPYEGFYWMGATIICLSAVTNLLYWPM